MSDEPLIIIIQNTYYITAIPAIIAIIAIMVIIVLFIKI